METMTAEAYRAMIAAEDTQRGRKTATRRAAGHKARSVGQSFQDVLNHYHADLVAERICTFVDETKPPMRAVKVQGRLYYVLLPGGGPCDYLFHLTCGIAGSFDAKTSEKVHTFSWPDKRVHQLSTLRSLHERSGGRAAAFALVEWRKFNEVRLHPIWTIPGTIVRRDSGTIVPMVPVNATRVGIAAGPAWHEVVMEMWRKK
jgi:hypothetical protein